MPVVNPEKLVALQRNPEGIRNVSLLLEGPCSECADKKSEICILAHVVSTHLQLLFRNYADSVRLKGPWKDVSHRCAHCHERHYIPQTRWQD